MSVEWVAIEVVDLGDEYVTVHGYWGGSRTATFVVMSRWSSASL
jgi:hypothetical protein